MGSWGAGLYDDDRASDLRAGLKALCRLPLDGPGLLRIFLESEGTPDEVFWLVTADQFHKKGVICAEARDAALAIIEQDVDVERCARLGMDAALLQKRRKMLEGLALELRQSSEKKRTTLKKPQPLLMQAGEVIAYPVCGGAPLNPYLGGRVENKGWQPDGWAAMVLAEAEQLFGYLAWYRPAVAQRVWAQSPSISEVRSVRDWRLGHAATCSASHFKRLELQSIGRLELKKGWNRHLNERMMTGRSAALSDVSICNRMKVDARETFGRLEVGGLLA